MQNTDTNENREKLYSCYVGKTKLFIKFKEDKCAHVYA